MDNVNFAIHILKGALPATLKLNAKGVQILPQPYKMVNVIAIQAVILQETWVVTNLNALISSFMMNPPENAKIAVRKAV